MISSNDFSRLKDEFSKSFKELLKNNFYSDFIFYSKTPNDCMQYWKVELTYFTNYETLEVIEVPIGYFTMGGLIDSKYLSINEFFKRNDKILKEFYQVYAICGFECLLTTFITAKDKDNLGVVLNISSFNNCEDEYMRSLCEEHILIIFLSDKDDHLVEIDCQCSERYKIKVCDDNKVYYLEVPYDKVCFFPNAERVEGYNNRKYYEYEIALSFAGEDRIFVEKIAKILKSYGTRIFYDFYEKADLWGKDLYEHLDNVYRKKSKFCVLFLSNNYKQKVWTNHERKSAQARAFEEHNEYILPIRLDDTEIEGIRPTLGYIDGTKESPKLIAELIKNKLKRN